MFNPYLEQLPTKGRNKEARDPSYKFYDVDGYGNINDKQVSRFSCLCL